MWFLQRPFERGFGGHGSKWRYTHGDVHGHAAGEMARGTFEQGFESYGAGVLRRIWKPGKQHDGILHFAYTGAFYKTGTPPLKWTE